MPTWAWLIACGGCLVAGASVGLVVAAVLAASGARSRAEEGDRPLLPAPANGEGPPSPLARRVRPVQD